MMIEELPDDIENDVLDDIESVAALRALPRCCGQRAGDDACGQVSVRPPD